MPDAVNMSDEEEKVFLRLVEARKNASAWTKMAEDARNELRTLADARGADKVLTASGAPAFHLNRIHKIKINRSKLEAKHPAVFADVAEEVEEVRLELDLETSS